MQQNEFGAELLGQQGCVLEGNSARCRKIGSKQDCFIPFWFHQITPYKKMDTTMRLFSVLNINELDRLKKTSVVTPSPAARILQDEGPALKTGVDTPRPAAFRRITGNIAELAIFFALRTYIRRSGRRDGITAPLALPECQAATRTDIPDEFTGGRVATQGTFHLFVFLLHLPVSSFA
jgi:hypothetical protein